MAVTSTPLEPSWKQRQQHQTKFRADVGFLNQFYAGLILSWIHDEFSDLFELVCFRLIPPFSRLN